MTKKVSRRQLGLILVAGVVILIGLFFIFSKEDFAAKVDGQVISRQRLEEQAAVTKIYLRAAGEDYGETVVNRDSLDQLIREALILQYAEENEITVSQIELESYYQQRVNGVGSENVLLEQIEEQWGLDKESYLYNLEYDLLRAAVQKHIGMDLEEWMQQQYSEVEIINNL